MKIHKLTEKERKEARDVLRYYRKAYVCKRCGKIYGSDLDKEDSICHTCELKESK